MPTTLTNSLPAFGTFIQGGYFHGVFQIGQELWGEVTAPKAAGQITDMVWHDDYIDIPGTASDFDGVANTQAMLDAGSTLARAVRALEIDGHTDWYLPARGGLLLQYSNLKPLLTGDEAFAEEWHCSSTQFSRDGAYFQYFLNGDTLDFTMNWAGGLARAVRRFRIE